MIITDVADKERVLRQSVDFWNPGKTIEWQHDGISLVMGKREGYYFYDLTGKEFMDVHLNGGTFNLGHRNPEIIQVLIDGMQELDIGNHHFPSFTRAALAETMAKSTPSNLKYSIYSTGGSEAIDVALKSARYATQKENCFD